MGLTLLVGNGWHLWQVLLNLKEYISSLLLLRHRSLLGSFSTRFLYRHSETHSLHRVQFSIGVTIFLVLFINKISRALRGFEDSRNILKLSTMDNSLINHANSLLMRRKIERLSAWINNEAWWHKRAMFLAIFMNKYLRVFWLLYDALTPRRKEYLI